MSEPQINPNNISILSKSGCYGCGVCVNVCPAMCITMVNDEEGFPYPVVDQEACVDCRICIDKCPGLNDIDRERFLETPSFYAGYSLDDEVRYQSSSGGFFSLVAEEILAQGGAVYGAQYDFAQMTVDHARADDRAALAPLRKSKYVQSTTTHIFRQVKRDLIKEKPVLFTGTPCQVAGLNMYLRKSYENLVTCDNICHGVPSPGLFQQHFKAMAQRQGEPITQIDFRTKARGWKGPLELFLSVEFDGARTLTFAALDAYYALFLANISLRPCCYHCKFASTQRQADLTLGDFWGVKRHHPQLFDSKGTSLILANTAQGERLLQSLEGVARVEPLSEVRPFPPNLTHPTRQPKYRERFFSRVNLARWHPRRRWFHLVALAIIARDKLLGLVKRKL